MKQNLVDGRRRYVHWPGPWLEHSRSAEFGSNLDPRAPGLAAVHRSGNRSHGFQTIPNRGQVETAQGFTIGTNPLRNNFGNAYVYIRECLDNSL